MDMEKLQELFEEVQRCKKEWDDSSDIQVLVIHFEAKVAMALIDKFGAVAAVEDGEDSSGRHKTRIQTPLELVDRCMEIAELFYMKASIRDWISVKKKVGEKVSNDA